VIGISGRIVGRWSSASSTSTQILYAARAKDLKALCRKTGNQFALARILGRQGIYAVFEDNNEQARNDLHEALAIREALGDHAGIAKSLCGLSLDAFFQGDFPRARGLAEKSRALAFENNSLFPKAFSLSVLGWIAAIEEEYNKAWDLCQECLSIVQDPNIAYMTQFGLSISACGLGQYAVAKENVHNFFNSSSPLHAPKGYLSFLPIIVILYAKEHEFVRAIELLAVALTFPSSPTGWMQQWMLLNRWRTKLEAIEQYESAWERGKKRELEGVIREIRNWSEPRGRY
jgi:tetratricopeptide (TPR) repeat protein